MIISGVMFFTDLIAVSVVLIMAIGNRNSFVENLPHRFVNAEKFYSKLGPFWMYLGAITLHITVAFNMCFLQVFNNYLSYSKSIAPIQQPSQKETNNNL
ncbi:unnamed protein product [Auanema sp. JU1783]|nr:unnamed protein product [Auanema sp. JU1783]